MSRVIVMFGVLSLASVSGGCAMAQSGYPNQTPNRGYTIQTPGQVPTFVNPSGNGGYVVQTPGQTPTFVNPTGNGGYVVQTPGQAPTIINPR
jgi:hypothetical protein